IRRYITVLVIIAMIWFSVRFLGDAQPQTGGSWEAFAPAVDYVIALSVSWVPLAADFARHSRSSRAAFTGVGCGYTLAPGASLGLGVYAVAIAGAQAVAADSTAVFTPFVMAPLGA